MFEKILVAFDGSPHSIQALDIAVKMAKKFQTEISLIYVYSIQGFALTQFEMQVEGTARWVELEHQGGENILKEGQEIAHSKGLKIKTLLKEGHIVEEILKIAREEKMDLIILGARGLSRMKEMLLGSVSVGVTRHAPCPVLVAK